MVKSTAEVVIIGGGVMGASTAYHLAKRGVTDVVLVEQRYLASGPTGRSLANLRPYHGVEETVRIIHESSKIYLNFDEIIGGGGQFRNIGRVWAEPESNRALMQEMVALTGKVGMRSEYLDPDQLAEMVPGLNTEGLGSIVHFPDAGYSNPGGVTEAFAARAREQGVQTNEETKVTGIGLSGGRVQSVETDKGSISAPVVINAAGIWGPAIGRMVGIDLPITPTRGQGVIYQRHWSMPEFRPIFHDGRSDYIFRCEPGNLINVLNTLEIRDDAETVNPDTMPEDAAPELVDRHRIEGSQALPTLEKATHRGGYSCAYDITPDDSPIFEESEEVGGFYNMVGWSGLGMQQGPVAGDLMAELITTGTTTLVDMSIFSLRRFREGKSLASAWLFKEIGLH